MKTATNKPSTEETRYSGPFGTGTINKLPTGGREIHVEFSDGRTVKTESTCVDLERCGAKTLSEALFNALNKANSLDLFEKTVISGSKALVIVFRRPIDPSFGYATVVKKGTPSLRFTLSRVDLEAMESPDVIKALRKTAWETGSVRLKAE